MSDWAASLGVAMPDPFPWVSAAVALLLVVLAWGAGLLAARTVGPRLAAWWEGRAGARSEGMGRRMCDVARYLAAALILVIALKADRWPTLPAFIIGLPLALAAALLVREVVRGLQMPRWVAIVLALATFIALLADALGGLKPVTDLLDTIGFTVGRRHFSLLSLIQIAVTLLVLLAAVRLASRFANHSIRRSGASTRPSNCSPRSWSGSRCWSPPSSSASTSSASI